MTGSGVADAGMSASPSWPVVSERRYHNGPPGSLPHDSAPLDHDAGAVVLGPHRPREVRHRLPERPGDLRGRAPAVAGDDLDHPCGAEALAADALGVDHPVRQGHEDVARLHANRRAQLDFEVLDTPERDRVRLEGRARSLRGPVVEQRPLAAAESGERLRIRVEETEPRADEAPLREVGAEAGVPAA